MLFALAAVLFLVWALGFLAFHVTTAFFHLILLGAVVAVVFHFVSGRRRAVV